MRASAPRIHRNVSVDSVNSACYTLQILTSFGIIRRIGNYPHIWDDGV